MYTLFSDMENKKFFLVSLRSGFKKKDSYEDGYRLVDFPKSGKGMILKTNMG